MTIKTLKTLWAITLIVTWTVTMAQCPPNSSLGTIVFTPGQPLYCPGSNLSGVFTRGNTSWSFVTPVVWSYTGNNTIVGSGPNKTIFTINSLAPAAGNVQAACTLLVAGQQCPYSGSVPVTLSNLQVNAGNNQLFMPNGPAVTIGSSSCYANNFGTASVSWLPTTGIVGSNTICQPSVNNLSSNTTYVLTVTDSYCTATSQVKVIVGTEPYAVLKKTLDGGYYKVNSNNTIYFKYDSEYNTGNLVYKIYSDQNILMCNSCITLQKNYGDNRYSLLLSSAGISAAGFYYLEVTNEKKEVFKLKFKI